nr:MAG TPA: hypothetical protein [Caudoviricetes sp.]
MADKLIAKIIDEISSRDLSSFTGAELVQMLMQAILLKQYSAMSMGFCACTTFDEEAGE